MKKIILVASIVLAITVAIRIIRILITDNNNLTEYGWGYLTGLLILFIFFSTISFLIGRKHLKKE